MKLRAVFFALATVFSTTVGAGMFALPYFFGKAGWFSGIAHLVFLVGAVFFAHTLYFLTLEHSGGKRLVALLREQGKGARYKIFLLALFGGLLLSLVAYMALAGNFWHVLTGGSPAPGVFLFWAAGTIPVFFNIRRFAAAEGLGAMALVAALFWIGNGALPRIGALFSYPALHVGDLFLPFGAVLFSLAAWTAVEPVREIMGANKKMAIRIFGGGAALSALFYFGFVASAGALGAYGAGDVVAVIAEGFAQAGAAIALLGLFAIWTSYIPIAREVKNLLEGDLAFSGTAAGALVAGVPLVLYLAGLNQFIELVGLAGGIFLSFQYLAIIDVARRTLPLSRLARIGVAVLSVAFLLAAGYEMYYFGTRNW